MSWKYLNLKMGNVEVLNRLVLLDIALNLERNCRFALLRELRRAGVKWTCNFVVERVEDDYVVGKDGSRVEFETLI